MALSSTRQFANASKPVFSSSLECGGEGWIRSLDMTDFRNIFDLPMTHDSSLRWLSVRYIFGQLVLR
jgi:hypothetical protein